MREHQRVDARASSCHDEPVRTTVTLEPDVAAALRKLQRRTGSGQKALINEALRRGLRELGSAPPARAEVHRTEPFDPGPPAITGVHSVYDLLAFAEGEDFR
jgi:hypothetical protein